MLTLAEAIRTGRLPEFVAQEEARGVGPADTREQEEALRTSNAEASASP